MADTTVTDPLGRAITFSDRAWHGHIVKGHPEVAGHHGLATSAITAPENIRFSASDADCRKYVGPGPRAAVKMVVADIVRGVVKTAYLARKATGAVEWP